jgi:ABC-type lipoprotein export system ATPase subunit
MENDLVQMDNVSLDFATGTNHVKAVQHATCVIKAGDHIAITGPSGSGKSSLLNLIAGFDPPSSGTISWPALGAQQNLRPRHIGMAFQSPSLLPALTVLENVELPLLALEHLADRLPAELSGGQMQRVAFARALVTKPRLILADEPTGQLDQATGKQMIAQILEAIKSTDTALIIATHDLQLAKNMATQWQMDFGQLNKNTALGLQQ